MQTTESLKQNNCFNRPEDTDTKHIICGSLEHIRHSTFVNIGIHILVANVQRTSLIEISQQTRFTHSKLYLTARPGLTTNLNVELSNIFMDFSLLEISTIICIQDITFYNSDVRLADSFGSMIPCQYVWTNNWLSNWDNECTSFRVGFQIDDNRLLKQTYSEHIFYEIDKEYTGPIVPKFPSFVNGDQECGTHCFIKIFRPPSQNSY